MKVNGRKGSAPLRRRSAAPTAQWLTKLNEQMSTVTRSLFQSPQLLQSSTMRVIHEQFPQLWAFIASVHRESGADNAVATAVREAFAHKGAQWLSRSAVESGATSLLCHLLLHVPTNASEDERRHAVRVVLHVLFNPVLTICRERGDTSVQACEWTHVKPRYYAMKCSTMWETLLPFLARVVRLYPSDAMAVLEEYLTTERRNERVNCRFAQVAGLWRLMETLGDVKHGDQGDIMTWILRFIVQHSVLCATTDAADVSDRLYVDMLMDKFFQGLQEFLFKCTSSASVALSALKDVILTELQRTGDESSVRRQHLAVFTAVACSFVKNLSTELEAELLNGFVDGNLTFLVGFVSFVDRIELDSVLGAIHVCFDGYQTAKSTENARHKPEESLFWAVYLIQYHRHALKSLTSDHPSYPEFVRLQECICSEVELSEWQLLPIHWMERFWKTCLGMNDEEIEAFAEETRANRLEMSEDVAVIGANWEQLVQDDPFRHGDKYPLLAKTLGTGYIERLDAVQVSSSKRSALSFDEGLVLAQERKRQRRRQNVVVLSEEHEESRQNTLLLPEVMEKICSFMSAKRLCRLALVCRAFSEVSRSQRLWHGLYVRLVEPFGLTCQHGPEYEHHWRNLYRGKFAAIKRLRQRQRKASKRIEREMEDAGVGWGTPATTVPTLGNLQLCGYFDWMANSDAQLACAMKKVAESASTTKVVWAAATRIGKADNASEVHRICDYLISKHWFQTAGDLRVARANTTEWHALEVPARLKIAIQEVLDEPADVCLSSIAAPNDVSRVTTEDNATAGVAPVPMEYPIAGGIATEHASLDATASVNTYPEGDSAQTEVEVDEETRAAAWAAYYAAYGYYAPTEYAEQWDNGTYQAQDVSGDPSSSVAQELPISEQAKEPFVPAPSQESKTEWSCGQCTYLNSMTETFCEMCTGHVSLSPDYASIQPEDAAVVVSPETVDPEPPLENVLVETTAEAEAPVALPPPPPAPVRSTSAEPPLSVSIPCPASPLSPLYPPSAPAFECLSLEDEADVNGERAKILAFGGSPSSTNKHDEVSRATTTAEASLKEVDFLALAFHKPAASAQTLTEYTF
ncbi:hypothetical protein Poli38472_009620 [Pythium oligandrum]|uniref:RanBP2-type domain-containing protein n=1 Tax=Pythium oligandrum TaxID=41045 RepID=A0A8K1CHA4_PYTOL|nr:hypothetical protein Poli38472_009620 [Pythium oligandrum]|eukprot:TMW62127.1 hypothetical protein Poli38472_009620 [Pythium oligandrum]